MIAKPGKTAKTSKPQAVAKPAAAKKSSPLKPAPAKTVAAKAVSKPASKTAPKASAPSVTPKVKMSPVSTNKSPAPAKATSAKPTAPAAPAKPKSAPDSAAAVSRSAIVEPVAPVLASSTLTQRPGRPSSRLASLTVPSMAQSVASTAAKASYMQLATAPLIVPPLPSATKKDPTLANNWKTKPVEQLTDAELLAMPDSEYMNDKQMAAFRLKLSLLKQDILNSAGETTEHLREDTVVVPDPADRATIEEEHALELRTRDRERKLLKKIEQSIARIDAGDYGYCDETGEPIGVGRLLARPTATLSLEAQQRRELKQKMFGD